MAQKTTVETQKIIVKTQEELIDILRKVESSEAEKIVLTFTEQSDLLISPINLKVVQELADEQEKVLITQIVQNPVGVRNATLAGMLTTDSPGAITEVQWKDAEDMMNERKRSRLSKLRSTSNKTKVQEVPDKPKGQVEGKREDQTVPTPQESSEPSEFQKRIDATLEKSKGEIKTVGKKVVETDGVVLALGQDINQVAIEKEGSPVQAGEPSLVGRDFSGVEAEEPMPIAEQRPRISRGKAAGSMFAGIGKVFAKIAKFFASIPLMISKMTAKAGFRVVLVRLIIPLLIILGLSGWLAYRLAPLVKVELFIESKPVTIDKTFTGDASTQEFSLENLKVPVKKEEVTKKRSDSATTTGVAYRGEKATGIADFKFFGYNATDENTVTIPAGTVITNSTEDVSFVTTTEFVMGGPIGSPVLTKEVAVTAADVGEEYNISSGVAFTVAGFDATNVVAESSGSFTGGSKEEYVVVSQSDVDDVVKTLTKDAYKDAEEELAQKEGNDWEIIESTIKSAVQGDIGTDVPVGAEAEVVNISLETKSTALYFRRGDIDNAIEEMIQDEAANSNLFESSGTSELKLDKDYEYEVAVAAVQGETVSVKVTASSSVRPDVNKEKIAEDLAGLKWDEGNKYIRDLKFTSKDSEVEFLPEGWWDFLKHFPERQGRVLIKVTEVQSTIEEE